MNYPQLSLTNNDDPQAIIETTMGVIELQLFPTQAPQTVENFIKLAQQGYYNNVIFHRVIPDFMIQGGDPTGTGRGGESAYGHPFADEFSEELFNFTGALSMANAGPNTNGSQFFIVTNDHLPESMVSEMQMAGYPPEIIDHYQEHGGTPWLDFHHTVFGQVVAGMDVVEKISKVKRNRMDKPKKDVTIKRVTIEND